MEIQIQGTNLELTPEIKEYVNKKVDPLRKFLKSESEVLCDVELINRTERGKPYQAQINCSSEGKLFRATAEGDTLYEAIDLMQSDLKRELTRSKDKEQTLFRKGAMRVKNMLRGLGRG